MLLGGRGYAWREASGVQEPTASPREADQCPREDRSVHAGRCNNALLARAAQSHRKAKLQPLGHPQNVLPRRLDGVFGALGRLIDTVSDSVTLEGHPGALAWHGAPVAMAATLRITLLTRDDLRAIAQAHNLHFTPKTHAAPIYSSGSANTQTNAQNQTRRQTPTRRLETNSQRKAITLLGVTHAVYAPRGSEHQGGPRAQIIEGNPAPKSQAAPDIGSCRSLSPTQSHTALNAKQRMELLSLFFPAMPICCGTAARSCAPAALPTPSKQG